MADHGRIVRIRPALPVQAPVDNGRLDQPGHRTGRVQAQHQGAVGDGLDELLIVRKAADGENTIFTPRIFDLSQPAIKEITRVSKPGRRVYSKIAELPKVYKGLGTSILSTPRGVMSENEARAANVGGEVLCRVF